MWCKFKKGMEELLTNDEIGSFPESQNRTKGAIEFIREGLVYKTVIQCIATKSQVQHRQTPTSGGATVPTEKSAEKDSKFAKLPLNDIEKLYSKALIRGTIRMIPEPLGKLAEHRRSLQDPKAALTLQLVELP